MFTLSTLYKKYNTSRLKKGWDPDVYMTYLGDITMQMADMGHTCTDKQFMLHVLANLGDDSEYVQYHIDHCLSSLANPLTIEELRAELNARYEKLKSKLNREDRDNNRDNFQKARDGDKALYAGGKFKSACYECGVIGHKGSECKSASGKSKNDSKPAAQPSTAASTSSGSRPPSGQGGSSGNRQKTICAYCKRPGHRESQCFDKKLAQRASANVASGANPNLSPNTQLELTMIEAGYSLLFSLVLMVTTISG
jgi:Zinc knuckle